METHYFLGSNSPKGFLSLYDKFTDPKQDRLCIIKGFPGTGKSGFMRKIGSRLAEAGADVEYIHCSGDPDSLDGIYLPQLHAGYVDGTAPHVAEPRIPGGCETYVNLAEFCDTAPLESRRDDIAALFAAYRDEYAKAYDCLAAVSAVKKALAPVTGTDIIERVRQRGEASARRKCKGTKNYVNFTAMRCFLSAVTCRGIVTRWDTVSALADSVTVLDNSLGLAPYFIAAAESVFRRNGFAVISLASPEDAEVTEHIIVPELGIAYISADRKATPPFPDTRRLHLDDMARAPYAPLIRRMERIAAPLTADAVGHLAAAKAIHDELESFYTPLMDFAGVDALALRHTEMLLKKWTNTKNGV